jgi:hypothetical protein
LSGRFQIIVSIGIWISPCQAANLALRKRHSRSFYEERKQTSYPYFSFGGTADSGGYLDLCQKNKAY